MSCLSPHLILLVSVIFILSLFLYFYVATHVQTIKNPAWRQAFRNNGIDPDTVSITEKVWHVNGKSTDVCAGNAYDLYKPSICYAGYDRYKKSRHILSIDHQAKMVKEAIENDGVHPLSPAIY